LVFRGKNENYKFSEEILDNLKCVLDGKKVEAKDLNSTRVMAIYGRSLADIYIKLMSIRGKKINYSEAIDYDQANSLIGDGSYGASFWQTNYLELWENNFFKCLLLNVNRTYPGKNHM